MAGDGATSIYVGADGRAPWGDALPFRAEHDYPWLPVRSRPDLEAWEQDVVAKGPGRGGLDLVCGGIDEAKA